MVEHGNLTPLGSLLQGFFGDRLIKQRQVSRQTVDSYRDTFRLLLTFLQTKLRKKACELCMEDLDAPLIVAFLDHLETERHNCVRTRNTRQAAIRSFLTYASLQAPMALHRITPILAIPMKRFQRATVGFLNREEVEAILEAPDHRTWSGRRDRVLLTVLYNTGARVSEIVAAKLADYDERNRSIHLWGKGRKGRQIPLWERTVVLLRNWLAELPESSQSPLFPNRQGDPLTRSGVAKRLKKIVQLAEEKCPSLKAKRVSPHVLRHTTAMHLLQSGVDLTVIAMWLGHESVVTTHHYLTANLKMKEQALAKLQPPSMKLVRFKPEKDILGFLDRL